MRTRQLQALIALTLLLPLPLAVAQQAPLEQPGHAPLVAGVNYLVDLVPADLFGHWQRVRHVDRTSAPPSFFSTSDQGLWTISRLGDTIYFLNPDNGIKTQLNVTQVVDNTATFAYKRKLNDGTWCEEELSLTPEYDRLSGTQSKSCFRKGPSGQPEKYFFAEAHVEGKRATSLPPLK